MTSQMEFPEFYRRYTEISEEPRYEHISSLFKSVEAEYKERWSKANPDKKSPGQAWNNWKGDAFKRLTESHLHEVVQTVNERHGLSVGVVDVDLLYKSDVGDDLLTVKDAVTIDGRNFGPQLANIDFAIYDDMTGKLKAIIVCKTSMRERLAATLFWTEQLRFKHRPDNVQSILVTLDEDNQLRQPPSSRGNKNYTLAHLFLNRAYVLASKIQETERVVRFGSFEKDLRTWGGGV